eukprot:TRINITY_DN27296_c0_g2_i1.p1 TRINITY_DN27296_c0_g2~~TRINITY_DN27296_c0_g2_i1.p1  ORF type:complete len:779 (-),score=229.42 TRINITY_DN27296_c0_g2_i1:558-2663(-)
MATLEQSGKNWVSKNLGVKLPEGVTGRQSEGLRFVRRHLAPLEGCLERRHPSRLEVALKEAKGTRYLKTLEAVRRSRSTPAMQKHALEICMATSMTKASVKLGQWQQGVRDISTARYKRDAEMLRGSLEAWRFSPDEPEVAAAKEDLDRWQRIEETLPPQLTAGLEAKDIQTLKNVISDVGNTNPSNLEGLKEARQMVRRHGHQLRQLQQALDARSAEAMRHALDAWEFDQEEPLAVQVAELLASEDAKTEALTAAMKPQEGGPVHEQLKKAVDGWAFETENASYKAACKLLQQHDAASERLGQLVQKGDVVAIKEVLDKHPFVTDDANYAKATQVLKASVVELQEALSKSDGVNVSRLWQAGAGTTADAALKKETSVFLERYKATCDELAKAVSQNSLDAVPRIAEIVQSWKFGANDPNLEKAQAWLPKAQEEAAQRAAEKPKAQAADANVVAKAEDSAEQLEAAAPASEIPQANAREDPDGFEEDTSAPKSAGLLQAAKTEDPDGFEEMPASNFGGPSQAAGTDDPDGFEEEDAVASNLVPQAAGAEDPDGFEEEAPAPQSAGPPQAVAAEDPDGFEEDNEGPRPVHAVAAEDPDGFEEDVAPSNTAQPEPAQDRGAEDPDGFEEDDPSAQNVVPAAALEDEDGFEEDAGALPAAAAVSAPAATMDDDYGFEEGESQMVSTADAGGAQPKKDEYDDFEG